jgi:hypothetical protein
MLCQRYDCRHAVISSETPMAAEMESEMGRLPVAASDQPQLRENFDRQRYLPNQETWHASWSACARERVEQRRTMLPVHLN